ncbi:MAG TPA: formylglycine-generating enzyme family protein [Devosia sp.]|nr:formylglycine-generating enzyme family protein [Devosia sp.]
MTSHPSDQNPDGHCCAPARSLSPVSGVQGHSGDGHHPAQPPHNASAAHDEVALPGGVFRMGDCFGEGYPADGEVPVHEVELGPFSIDVACVTVAQFAAFIEDTGYRTEAEAFGNAAVFHLSVAAQQDDVIGHFGVPWWLAVQGADWRHPFGRFSDAMEHPDHPVVQVSHNDALAYCAWAGRRLPTEAEWEYAARGGKEGLRFPWGNMLEQDGMHHANVWQGQFPTHNTGVDGWLATAPVRSFAPNGFGLYQTSGNVWEWCADWFSRDYYARSPRRDPRGPETGSARVTRGGSYLCHESYCSRYRIAARTANTPDSATANMGFRTVAA